MYSAPRIPPQTTIGRYRIVDSLGEGATAVVYRAEATGAAQFCREVALKVLHAQLTTPGMGEGMIGRFVGEARLGGLIDHPNIVRTLDFDTDDQHIFIAMEFVRGCTVSDLFQRAGNQRRGLPETVALHIWSEVAAALAYAHSLKNRQGKPQGLVHRDLKPSNILVSHYSEVKLSDFGVARAADNILQTVHPGTLKGTLPYMSPEQALGMLELDGRSDIFSLGLVAFELFTGQLLYRGRSRRGLRGEVLQQVTLGQARELVDAWEGPLRAEIRGVLSRCLARAPEHRYQRAEDLCDALKAAGALRIREAAREWLCEEVPRADERRQAAEQALSSSSGSSLAERLESIELLMSEVDALDLESEATVRMAVDPLSRNIAHLFGSQHPSEAHNGSVPAPPTGQPREVAEAPEKIEAPPSRRRLLPKPAVLQAVAVAATFGTLGLLLWMTLRPAPYAESPAEQSPSAELQPARPSGEPAGAGALPEARLSPPPAEHPSTGPAPTAEPTPGSTASSVGPAPPLSPPQRAPTTVRSTPRPPTLKPEDRGSQRPPSSGPPPRCLPFSRASGQGFGGRGEVVLNIASRQNATISVDGVPKGAGPLTCALTPGRHTVVLESPTHGSMTAPVFVSPGGSGQTLFLNLATQEVLLQ